jgi:hypothetical protein
MTFRFSMTPSLARCKFILAISIISYKLHQSWELFFLSCVSGSHLLILFSGGSSGLGSARYANDFRHSRQEWKITQTGSEARRWNLVPWVQHLWAEGYGNVYWK